MKNKVLKDFLKNPVSTKSLVKKDVTMAYQLGLYVGEYIIDRYLPTLSIDYIHTNNNISVTCAEGDEYRRLENIWFNKKRTNDSVEWETLKKYENMLYDKYLPKILECRIPLLSVQKNDIKDFKKALISVLWNCDCCSYSIAIDDIIIGKEKIFLKR